MKGGKPKQVVLLLIVVLVWGGVLYQFIDLSSGSEDDVTSIKLHAPDLQVSDNKPYHFFLNYPDPFLKGSISSQERSFVSREEKERVPHDHYRFPKIIFQGVVHGRKPTGILSIDGKIHMINVGSEIGDLKVLGIDNNQIKMLYQQLDSVTLIGRRP